MIFYWKLLVEGIILMKMTTAILMLSIGFAFAHDEKSHANLDPNERDWFGEQKIPGGPNQGGSCCTQNDGEYAEEDIRQGHYWARWPKSQGVWHMVPDEAVIKKPNLHGRPAVWFSGDAANKTIYIRCFIAGALL